MTNSDALFYILCHMQMDFVFFVLNLWNLVALISNSHISRAQELQMSGGFCSRHCRSRKFLQLERSRHGFYYSLGRCPEIHTNQNVQIVLSLYGVCLCVHGRQGVWEEWSRDKGVVVCQSFENCEAWDHSITGVKIKSSSCFERIV